MAECVLDICPHYLDAILTPSLPHYTPPLLHDSKQTGYTYTCTFLEGKSSGIELQNMTLK
jgi:hypothetical protein